MAITGLIFFGDSILAGTGASTRDLGCAKLVKSALTFPVSLRTRNWNTSEDGLQRLSSDVLSQKDLSHVFILFGNNDCWFQADGVPKIAINKMHQNLIEMGTKIKNNGQVPIFCNLQPINSKKLFNAYPELCSISKSAETDPSKLQGMYSKEIKRIADLLDCQMIDIRLPLESEIEFVLSDDGLHPNDRGHRVIALQILKRLNQLYLNQGTKINLENYLD